MDPDAALERIIDDILLGNFMSAQETLSSLEEWRDNGGFQPADPRKEPKHFNIIAWHRESQK